MTLGSLSQTYSGTAKTATATTSPNGLTVNFTYNSSPSAPVNAGSYAVIGTISDNNYQGSASGTLVIGKATATVTLGSLSQTYSGTAKTASATTSPNGLTVNFTYNASAIAPTNAGSYTVIGTISDNNYQGSASGTLVIGKATATVTLGSLSQTYDGTAKTATATTSPNGLLVTFTYNASSSAPTNAGSYAVIGTISDNNYQGSASGTLVISKATATVTLGSLSQTYDGTAKTATATTSPNGLLVTFTYNASAIAPTNAGSYTVVGTISDNNYQGSASGTLVIGKATATVTLGSLSQTYDGTAKTATATTSPSGLLVTFTYDGSTSAPVNAGSYTVVGTISDNNYQGSASGTLVIGKVTAAVTFNNLTQTYDGTAKFASATTSPSGLSVSLTYNGSANAPTNAGSYQLIGTVTDLNGQGSATNTLVIQPAALTITASDDIKVYGQTRSYGAGSTAFTSSGLQNGETIGSVTITASGGTVTNDPVGSYSLTPSAATGGTFNAANYSISYVNGTLNVSATAAALTVTSTKNPAGYQDAVAFIATLPADATGSVVFCTTNGAFSTNAVSGGSASSAALTSLPRGTNIITASYSGDSIYQSASNTFAQVVTNHPPVAGNASYTRSPGIYSLRIGYSQLFTNVSDVDGDAFTVIATGVSTNGINITRGANSLTYQNTNYVNDQFTYTVSDGHGGSATGTIYLLTSNTAMFGQTNPQLITTNGTAVIHFVGIPGYSYTVQRTADLLTWSDQLTTNAPLTGLFQYTDLNPPQPSAFYRLQWNP